ncbi:MAG: CvpA family protein [Acholeplasmatales bacterium]|nr:CvpA family protein [Acholeplasmatales bacterium]
MFLLTSSDITLLSFLPTVLFAFILVWQMIAGARRGFSKSLKLFITFTISIIVASVFFAVVCRYDFDSYLVNDGLTTIRQIPNQENFSWAKVFNTVDSHDKFTGYLTEYLSNQEFFKKTSEGMSAEQAAKLLFNLSIMILHLIVFFLAIIVYFAAKFVLYFFYLIFFREGRRRKRINKKYSEGKVDKPYKPHRFLGFLVGTLRGLIVGVFIMSFFGTIALITTNDKTEHVDDTSYVNAQSKPIVEVYQIMDKYNTVGVGKVLNSVKYRENVPLYLIVADKIISCDYEYEAEDGTINTVKLNLSDDIATLTAPTSKIAYLFLLYGYDINKNYTTDEMISFITSDTTVNGKTLEERINDELAVMNVKNLNYVLNDFLRAFASYYCNGYKSTDSQDAKAELNASQRVIYQLFLGQYALKFDDLINGNNMQVAFNTLCDVLKNKNEIDKISSLMSSNSSDENLSIKFSSKEAKAISENNRHIFGVLIDDISKLSFYGDNNFNSLISTIIVEILEMQYPNFSLESSAPNQDFLNISWTSNDNNGTATINSLFNFLDYIVSVAIENESITSYSKLIDYFVSDFKKDDSEALNQISKLVDSSACSILLNTKGFKEILNSKMNEYLSSAMEGKELTLIDTNYGTYTDSDGKVHTGEINKILKPIAKTLASVYLTSKDTSLSDSDKTKELLNAVTSPDSSIYDLIDTKKENHSDLVHALLSEVILNVNFKIGENDHQFYARETIDYVIVREHKEINSNEFKVLLSIINKISNSFVEMSKNDNLTTNDYIDIVNEMTNTAMDDMKNSDLFMANLSIIIYDLTKNVCVTPSSLKLTDETRDTNIANWIGNDGEMSKLFDVFKNLKDIIVKISNGDKQEDYLAQVSTLSKDELTILSKSDLVNATITDKISKTDSMFVPDEAYKTDSNKELLSDEEISNLASFIKEFFNVTDENTKVSLENIENNDFAGYNDNPEKLLKALEGKVVSATLANIIVKNANKENSINVAIDYLFTKEEQNNLSKWYVVKEDTTYTGELANIIYALSSTKLLNVINDNSKLTEDVLLKDSLDTDRLLVSDTIWLTISKKLINTNSLIIPQSIIDTQKNMDTYISKDEINKFVGSIKNVITSDSLSTSSVDASSVLANASDSEFFSSKIIRAIVTDKILESGNKIALSRTPISDPDTTTTFAKEDKNFKTEERIYLLTANELNYFIKAANTVLNDENNTFEINYDTVDLMNCDESIFDSSIILVGLADNTRTTIAGYNIYVEPDYIEDSDKKANYIILENGTAVTREIISKENAKGFIQFVRNHN